MVQVDSYALVPLTSRRPDVDPLPPPVHSAAAVSATVVSSPLGPRRTPSSTSTTPRSLRRTPVHQSTSVQQLEWQRMLRTTNVADCDDDEEICNYLNDNHHDAALAAPPLPPPPAFLLRAAAGAGRRAPLAPKTAGRAPLVTDEILDGYHSGDNVDDDIERIGYVAGFPPRPQHASQR